MLRFSALRKAALVGALLAARVVSAQSAAPPIVWHAWSDSIFAQAEREHKFVLLDLEAVWCHWCHVMDQQTYSDPAVRRLMAKRYIAVKVDQDSRPDISNRYEDYGWPATVIFNGHGGEIVKRQGYLPPIQMASILQAVIDDPSPGPSVEREKALVYANTPYFSTTLLAGMNKEFEKQWDQDGKGWAFGHKYLDADSVEYANVLAARGDRVQQIHVGETLREAQKLLDPVWGGSYQYSTGGNWNEPHFEKLILIQAQALRAYADSYGQWRDPAYLSAAQNVHRYVHAFLTSPEGAFYVSQDADVEQGEHSDTYFAMNDASRRKTGIPRVDQHLYARENGWMIRSLCTLFAVAGDDATLQEAVRAARWVLAHRGLSNGGFSHDEHDVAGPYLGDTLAMGQAFLSLYEVTGDREWLKRAEDARQFLGANFASPSGAGFVTAKAATDHAYKPHQERDENVQVARFATLLAHYSGNKADSDTAARAMKYLATPDIALAWLSGPVLLAEREFTRDPVHITVEGGKNDASAKELFRTALRSGPAYKRVEWWDPKDGAPPRDDIEYPKLAHAAAFLCTATACSSPMTDAKVLEERLKKTARTQ